MKTIRIGSGAGYSGDRIEPAVELAEKGGLDYLVFECLAERTIALAQQARMKDPERGLRSAARSAHAGGASRLREERRADHHQHGRGQPRRRGARRRARSRASSASGAEGRRRHRRRCPRHLRASDFALDNGKTIAALGDRVISANAYIGAAPIVAALQGGADVVMTGRAADPAIFVAPLIHEFGWAMDDWTTLGRGTLAGHLLECAGQITGGYFADPGFKDVADLARLGFPIGEVGEDGELVVTKVAGSGGAVTARTCKEQLLYEIHDPQRYLQPDVVADFSEVRVEEIGRTACA